MLADASVLRNFVTLGWVDHLVALAGGTVYVAHGVMGLNNDDLGEIEGIRASFEEESLRHPGSSAGTAATVALVGLDALLGRRSNDITVLSPTADEFDVAVRSGKQRETASSTSNPPDWVTKISGSVIGSGARPGTEDDKRDRLIVTGRHPSHG